MVVIKQYIINQAGDKMKLPKIILDHPEEFILILGFIIFIVSILIWGEPHGG